MFKTYFKQALQMLRQNPFISIISTLGTALAIMMIMVIIVSENIDNIRVAPEVNRDRSYYSNGYTTRDTVKGIFNVGGLNYRFTSENFLPLKVPEMITAFEYNYMQGYRQSVVNRDGEREYHKIDMRFVDDVFWKVFSFDFLAGAPFTHEEFEAGIRKAVISRTTARNLFGSDDPIGKVMQIDNIPYVVAGVVRDVSPVFKMAYGNVWAPYKAKTKYDHGDTFKYQVVMVLKSRDDYPRLVEEIKEMERLFSTRDHRLLNLGAPSEHARFDGTESNDTYKPSYEERQYAKWHDGIQRGFLFLLLLLVPAMNLSGFSVSRMKKRIEEIGIRKAFGARTGTVLVQVLYENVITALIGGILGLILSYVAIFLLKGWILGVGAGAAIPFRALVSPMIFGTVIVLCVLLSLISSGIPALRAARKKIVDSISKNDR